MGLTRLAVTRPLAVLMFIIALVLMGVVSYRLLRVDRMPNVSFPWVNVSVTYAGASPQDAEEFIAKPIEAALSGLAGVSSIGSTSTEGRATVNIQLVEGADANQSAVDIERRLAAIRSRLPVDAGVPTVNKADPNSFPVMNVSLNGPLPIEQLYEIATNDIQPRIQSILGVADVSVSGGRQREIQVRVDPTKLEAYGLSLQQITNAVQRENVSVPAGSLTEGRQSVAVRSLGLFRSAADLRDLIISNTSTGPIFLRDVATVVEGYKDVTRFQRYNGNDSVGLSVTKQSDANSLLVAEEVRQTVERAQRLLPPGVQLTITNDSSRFTRAALDAVQFDLGMAILLTAMVLVVFLHTWRNTVIVVLAIPTSLISTFLVMYAFGFSLNTMSMLALALMIGILVDDSIVVLENINRHLHLGDPPMLAALKGRSEIGLAAIAITLTDIVVYLPVAFMQGNIGRMFKEYGLTIAAATLFSLLISFTLTPMLASRWLKEGEELRGRGPWAWFTNVWESGYNRLASAYAGVLTWSLRHRPVIVVVGFAALAGAYAFIPLNLLGTEYAPQEDDNAFRVSVQLPPGTSLEVTDRAVRQMEAGLNNIPEVQALFTSVGSGGFGPGGGGRSGSIDVQLVDKRERSRTVWQIMSEVRRLGAGIPEVNIQVSMQSGFGGGGGGGGGQIRILGDDLETLTKLAAQIEQSVRQVPGVVDVRNSALAGTDEVRAVLNRRKMAELGIAANQVATTLRTAISGSVITQLRGESQTQVDITLKLDEDSKRTISDIAQIPIFPTTGQTGLGLTGGQPVRLGQIATITKARGPAQIVRSDRQRVITVSTQVSGRPIGDVARDIREQLRDVPVPTGYRVVLGGQVQMLEQAFNSLLAALALSIVLIYMLMVALYESWLYPLAIMFSLPVSIVGAFGGLLLTGNTLNIFSMIGIIMLMGLVAKNAILLVDYTNTLRARGEPRNRAIVEAGRTRLRPILMTTATIVCAMIPLALKFEAGAESRSPMAVVVIGGVISSTLLTLVLVPVMYTYLDALQALLFRRRATQPAVGFPLGVPRPISGGSNGGHDAGH
ncbi:MAG: efflux RND transporter permease subunit [Chloroflexi bacterium]|nr:efflux RND transporter permease subunit [Chloroflexota bacterium]